MDVFSLFSGIGGADLGLERAGMNIVGFCELDPSCQNILKKHWSNIPIYPNITTLNKDTLKNQNIDVLVGGFPCQDISFSGKRKGILKGKRSNLWKEYWRLISEIRPKYAIIENVEYLRKNGLGIVLNDLARIGYDAEWATITARSVNLPHQRKRLFIISYPSGQRQYEYLGERRPLFIDEKWETTKAYCEGEERKSELVEICPILSKWAFDSLSDTIPDNRAAISGLCRVTNGVPGGLDESRRRQRIKQLGNAIVPQIMEIIGRAILDYEKKESI